MPPGKATHPLERPGRAAPKPPPALPAGYVFDESDPDILVLRRRDGPFVAAFSAAGATTEGVRRATEADRPKRAD